MKKIEYELAPYEYEDTWHHTAIINGRPEIRDFTDDKWYTYIGKNVRINEFATIHGAPLLDNEWEENYTNIGDNVLIMTKAHIGHNVHIGSNSEISSGAIIGGHSIIHSYNRIGLNATILPYRHISIGCRIGAGSVVTKQIKKFEVWAGNPAKFIRYVNDDEAKSFYNEKIYHYYKAYMKEINV